MAPVRVVIVDDHPFITKVLTMTLADDPGVELLGICESGAAALAQVPEWDPDVVVLDQALRDMTGTEVLEQLRGGGSRARFLMFSAMLDSDLTARLLELGAAGCISKRTKPAAVLDAIHRVAAGERVVGAEV